MNDFHDNNVDDDNAEKCCLEDLAVSTALQLSLRDKSEEIIAHRCEKDSDVIIGHRNEIKTVPILLCDAGYGLPREGRPRKEKILAIARQLVNFLEWQIRQQNNHKMSMALVKVVACPDESTRISLLERTVELFSKASDSKTTVELPSHVTFSCQPLGELIGEMEHKTLLESSTLSSSVVYLSPDASDVLNPSDSPPDIVVVGLIIDRRIQPNKSQQRANALQISAKRWPLEDCCPLNNEHIDTQEPLNVDCILEGMQQWWWNCQTNADGVSQHQKGMLTGKERFLQAANQALMHHVQRHPSRPIHKV